MMRRLFASAALGVLVGLMLPALPASAGGGCHSAPTQGTGTTIRIAGACFGPTILRVDPGRSVTWVNTDPMTHNITANGWGHYDDLLPGERYTATFAEPGIYPFACTYHPGMSGAIVVGDGLGAGSGTAVTTGTDVLASAEPAAEASARAPSGGSPGAWAGGAALGFGLALALAFAVKRPIRR
jgi:plastocyanin